MIIQHNFSNPSQIRTTANKLQLEEDCRFHFCSHLNQHVERSLCAHDVSIHSLDFFFHLILKFPIFVKPEQELTFKVVSINVACIHLYVSQDETKNHM